MLAEIEWLPGVSAVAVLLCLSLAGCGPPGPQTVGEPAESERRGGYSGARFIDFAGYERCICLENENTSVVLGPHTGGRVLEYSWKGTSAIYLDPKHDGWVYEPGKRYVDISGGRFDIGPEMVTPRHPVLWFGRWEGEIIGPRKARMTSAEDESTGVQLIRVFELAEDSSHLSCTQIIRNVSNDTKEYCHWSRTFAPTGGIFVAPVNPNSRFPNKYIMYGPGRVMDYRPEDPNIIVRDGFFVVKGLPERPKLSLDPYAGWMAYLTPDNLLFVKKFPVYPDRVYNEMAAITLCVYYHPKFCELEPTGPRERIEPGKSASFTEDWWLLEYEKPSGALDPKALETFVRDNTASR